ncbi:MAG: DUF3488 and DUF4129 domain-containing transglutaminase family protein [Cyanosarcina radialis HA8281-LM2]|jgi:transglutaminase-like putative cysteine protease|nr:DUF3488 and DUF4129 domain-containing transglutaminase family protein [Cyanosarcina radialis HA8281-LM2]
MSPRSSGTLEIEDSLWLRVLVQALVIVGIIATDVAAASANVMSWWAIPLSIVGATWSWYRRRDRNIAVKFLIAMGMLLAMGLFFRNLFGNLNDTRLVLAELLVQLQVLHSFDLPRRKDLGYSMVIGLILLGVAGTVSQTLAFGPLLLLFLAIALPVLVLDYRSRLGLLLEEIGGKSKSRRLSRLSAGLSWRRLSVFLLVIVSLGLTIFALMPRFPGYQIRSFPVSSPIEQPGEFEGDKIINPGYVKEGTQPGQGSGGSQNQAGEGKLDKTFYYGFNDRINQNLRGVMEPKEVLRVRSQAPGYWRAMAFDRYTGQGWEISRNAQTQKLTRSNWSYRFILPPRRGLGSTKEIVQSFTAVAELPNVIPALSYPKELYFPTRQVALDTEGSLRSPVGLIEGLTYTVISQVPYRDRTLLGKASTNYPDYIRQYYLQVPPQIAAKVKQHTEELLANYNQNQVGKSTKPLTSTYEKTLYLAQYLKQRYKIPDDPLELPYLSKDDDLVDSFLFRCQSESRRAGEQGSRGEARDKGEKLLNSTLNTQHSTLPCEPGGYPDHFSTTLTVMLRSIGIPARLVVGFAPGDFNPFTGFYVVRNVDAYAMTEVYFPKYGWFAFDPIPGHDLIPPSIEEDQTFSVLKHFWNWVAGWVPSPVTEWLGGVWEAIAKSLMGAIAWFFALFSKGWLGWLTAAGVAIAVGFIGWLGWNELLSWRYRRWLATLHPMERLYQQMLKTLANQGYPKHPAQTPLEYAQVSKERHSPERGQIIAEISQAYVSWRYGQQDPKIDRLQQKWRSIERQRIARSKQKDILEETRTKV